MLSKEKWRIVRARLRTAFPVAVILTLLIGSWAVHNTPTTGQLEPPGWTMSFYASLQFFALGASGMPLEPKAPSGVVYLVVMFLAPVLLGGSAADFIFEFLRSFGAIQREVDHLRNHVVICGLGTHGHGRTVAGHTGWNSTRSNTDA